MKTEAAAFQECGWERNNRISGDPIAPLIPTLGFEDGLVVNVDGSFGVGWRCAFPYLITLSEARRAALFDTVKNALNVQTDAYDVQIIFEQSQRCEEFVASLLPVESAEGVLADYAREQGVQLAEAFSEARLRWIEGFVILVRRNPFPSSHFQRATDGKEKASGFLATLKDLFSSAAVEIAYTEDEWMRLKTEFFDYADSLHAALESAGCLPRVLTADAVLELFYRYWNGALHDGGGRPRRFHPAEGLALTDYFLTTGVTWDRETGLVCLGDRLHQVVVLRTPPERVQFSQFAPVLLHGGLFKTRYVITLRRGDLAKRKNLVRDRMRELEALARKNPEFEDDYREAVRELRELNGGTEKAWLAQQVFIVGGDTREEVARNLLILRKTAEQASGMAVEVETHAALDYLIAAQPFWTRDRDHYRQIPYNGSQLVTQLPLCGQNGFFQLSNGAPARVGAIYETTAQTLLNFFPHEDRRFNNANIMILGAAGSGKGMTVNDFMAQMRLRHPARFVIIDIGGSYRKTSEALCPGGYFDMTLKEA
ncbi:MAG TPA: type IV secretion system DNA-binding domain-containing protein, partial [Opitutaceae bacterium]|nr:type IV secretion system DNA-binding domain-containing protein [Opitutaceae bacterium]